MKFWNDEKLVEGNTLRCKFAFNSAFKVGEEYKINVILHNTKYFKSFDICINNYWFTLEGDYKNAAFPVVNSYFFSEQEERKIKLQILNLCSKIKEKV